MSELTDRMRTCAAHIIASAAHEYDDEVGPVMRDAAALLIAAADTLEAYDTVPMDPPGEPMEIIPAAPPAMQGTWVAAGDTLPVARPASPRTCPKCDSHAQKTVRRQGSKVMLVCPVCSHTWEYKP